MKRYICLIISLCLILSSFSFCFATPVQWDSTDSQHLTGIYNMLNNTYYTLFNSCNNTLSNINSNLLTLMGWLDPANGGGTSAILNQILNALVYTNTGGAAISYLTDLRQEGQIQSSYLLAIRGYTEAIQNAFWNTPMPLYYLVIGSNGTVTNGTPGQGNFLSMLQDRLTQILVNNASIYSQEYAYSATGYNTQQSLISFANPSSTVTFTPSSVADGLYKYLNAINSPLARLGYVLASDSRIDAQEAAAANEQAVVDNFIDSSGDASASPSDIGSISDLSSGYQQNFGSTASVTGIFNIFDSNNFGWFSSETYNQLDTTVAQRGSSFETPLLDQQLEDISRALGVDYAN